jgi:hypothetical protein
VTHTAPSLDADRPNVAHMIEDYIEAMPVGPSYHFGVMLAHANTQYAGALYTAGHANPVLTSESGMSLDAIGNEVEYRLNNIQRENETSGGEMGMYSVLKSLTNVASLRSQGFYRQDAGLAVVFITNEQDICAMGGDLPAGTPAETNSVEVTAFNNYCKVAVPTGAFSSALLTELQALKGSIPVKIGGILYPNTTGLPAGIENEKGYGPWNMTQEAGANGFVANLANIPGIPAALAPITSMVTTAPLITHFQLKLDQAHIDLSTLHVFVNGVEVKTFCYDFADSSICLDLDTPGLGPNAVVTIDYCPKA